MCESVPAINLEVLQEVVIKKVLYLDLFPWQGFGTSLNKFLKIFAFFAVTLGRNQPLKKERAPWTSEIPLTEGQLRSKRDEFWETAPAFEGRKEIWDALRAAAETDDHTWAQAIVDGANITLPTGKSTEACEKISRLSHARNTSAICLFPALFSL